MKCTTTDPRVAGFAGTVGEVVWYVAGGVGTPFWKYAASSTAWCELPADGGGEPVTADPRIGGLDRPIGSACVYVSGGIGTRLVKYGAGTTQWASGIVAAIGVRGIAGAAGAAGAMGPPGADGADGADGGMGPPGPTGSAGAAGATGPIGPAGSTGPPGVDGIDGVDGEVGPPGPAGAAGAAGATGATGATGPMGPPGMDGADGEEGPMGPPGPTGPQGPAGGGGGSATTVEKDLGATEAFEGRFTITDAAISTSSKVLVWQAPGPYTNKGTRADEAAMQPVRVIAVEPLSGSAIVHWQTPPMLAHVPFGQSGGDGGKADTTLAIAGRRSEHDVTLVRRLGKVRGNVKFSYLVLS